MKLSYVRLWTRSLDTAKEFYGRMLGLTHISTDDREFALYDAGGTKVLLERAHSNNGETDELIGRYAGVSFSVDDIDETYERLVKLGVRFTGPPEDQWWGGRRTDFSDPDGNVLTLVQEP